MKIYLIFTDETLREWLSKKIFGRIPFLFEIAKTLIFYPFSIPTLVTSITLTEEIKLQIHFKLLMN
jgi:hypothetical protein